MCHRCLSLAALLMAVAIDDVETIVSPKHPHHDGKLLTDEVRHDLAEMLHLLIPAMDANEKVDADKLSEFLRRIGVERMHLAYSIAGYLEGSLSAARAHFSAGVKAAAEVGSAEAKAILGSPQQQSLGIHVIVMPMPEKKPTDPTADFMRPLGASRLN